MTQVRATFFAVDFDAAHTVADIFGGFDGVLSDGFEETGPARTRLEFSTGIKQGFAATDASVLTIIVAVPVFTAEGALGAVLSRHAILFFAELLLPLCVGFSDFISHGVGLRQASDNG